MFSMRDAIHAVLCKGALYGCFKRGGVNEGEGGGRILRAYEGASWELNETGFQKW